MIILVTGDFGVGKDTFADMLVNHLDNSSKILSYTTRAPRNEEDKDNHIFITKEEWINLNDLIACTEINNEFYGTVKSQFGKYRYDIYVVDDIGIRDVLDSGIDDVYIVEIVRPKWLINVSENRLNRSRTDSYKFEPDYRIINDGSLQKLDTYAKEVATWLSVHTKN